MEITTGMLILVGVICVVLGFMASMLLGTLQDEEDLAAGAPETPPGGQKGRYNPIARLWREKSSDRLVVEVEGKTLVTGDALNETERARLEQAARDLRAWLGMGMVEVRPVPPVSASQPSPMQNTAAQKTALTQPPAESAAPATQASPRTPEDDLRSAWAEVGPEETVPAAPTPVSTYTSGRTRPPAPAGDDPAPLPSSAGKSIVLQIEDILQDMLYDSPLRSRGIHLTEDPTRGVIVSVGGKQYEGIDAVPDPEVKAFIRQAVSTWENSQ